MAPYRPFSAKRPVAPFTPGPQDVEDTASASSPFDVFKPVVHAVEGFTSGLQRGFNESGVGQFAQAAEQKLREPGEWFARDVLHAPEPGSPQSPEYQAAQISGRYRTGDPNYVPTSADIEWENVKFNSVVGFGLGGDLAGVRGPRVAPRALPEPARPLALERGAIPMPGAIPQPASRYQPTGGYAPFSRVIDIKPSVATEAPAIAARVIPSTPIARAAAEAKAPSFSQRVGTLTPVGRDDLVGRFAKPNDVPPIPLDELRSRIGAPGETAMTRALAQSREPAAPQGPLGASGMSGPLVGRAVGRGSSQLARTGIGKSGLEAAPADLNASLVRQTKVHDANEAAITALREAVNAPRGAENYAPFERAIRDVHLLGGDLKHTSQRLRQAGLPAPTAGELQAMTQKAGAQAPASSFGGTREVPTSVQTVPGGGRGLADRLAGFARETGGSTTVENALGLGVIRRALGRSGQPSGNGGYRPPLSAANQAARAALKRASETADQQFDRMVPPQEKFVPPARTGHADAPLPSNDIPGKSGRRGPTWEDALSVWNLPKALKASLDLSAPLRQGALLAAGHPGDFTHAFGAMLRSLVDAKYADALETKIRSVDRPGLYLRLKNAKVTARDEAFMSAIADKIPGVSHSQRAFNTFLNKLSADVYDSTLAGWKAGGKPATAGEASRLASVINHYVGRGDLPGFVSENMAAALNGLFFSPRYVASRFQSITDALGVVKHPSDRVARQAAGDMVKFVGAGLGILALAKLNGAEVEDDPRSASFGKIQVGPTQVDIWAGSQQVARYTAQFITGQTKVATGKNAGTIQDQSRGKTAARFFRSKLSPTAGELENIIDLIPDENFGAGGPTAKDKKANADLPWQDQIVGRDFIGDPVTPKTIPGDLANPLGWENAKQAFDATDDKVQATVIGLLALLGVGTTTIDDEVDAPDATPATPAKTPAPTKTPRPTATPRRTAAPSATPYTPFSTPRP